MNKHFYQKQNSVIDIREDSVDYGRIRRRILSYIQGITLRKIPAKRRDIILKIRRDLLSEGHTKDSSCFRIGDNIAEEIDRLSSSDLIRYLVYRYRYEIYPQSRILDEFPPCLQIEPSSICNYRCVFCYQTDRVFTKESEGHMGTMSLELFKSLIDQAEGNCEAITLANRGEPLICPEIESMLAYCRGKFLGLKMNTNAWYLDEKKAHAILESGLNVLVFSVDSTTDDSYRKLRVGGRLGRVSKNIRQFQKIRIKHYSDAKIITRVSGVKYPEDQSLDSMETFWGDMVDQVAFVQYNPWENVYSQAVKDISTPCSDLWRRMFVWFDGTVNPCDVDYKSVLAISNAKNTSLSNIWRSDSYNDIRNRHLSMCRNNTSPCNRCTFI